VQQNSQQQLAALLKASQAEAATAATLLRASQAAQLRGVLEHARELAQVQTAVASAQAAVARLEAAQASAAIGHARELAQVQAEAASAQAAQAQLAQLQAEVAELKRAGVHASAVDVEGCTDGGGAAGAGAADASGGGGSASGLQQLHASHQALLQVKQEKADVGEQTADKDELCSQVSGGAG
jgi:hypothetical protein